MEINGCYFPIIYRVGFDIERHFCFSASVLTIKPESAVVLGMTHGKLEFLPIATVALDADFKLTRPKTQWWMRLRILLRALAKHHCFDLTDT